MLRIVVVALVVWAVWHSRHNSDGQPRLQLQGTTVQLGDTVLTGKHLQPYNLDFFGGYNFFSLLLDLLLIPCFQVSLLPSLQSPTFASLYLALSFLFLPCEHSMPATMVSRAYSQ
jgi:hypothetical protein